MNAAEHDNRQHAGPGGAAAGRDLVYGLGTTGLSVARYLKRNRREALFVDSRSAPPGLEALGELLPQADVRLGRPAPALLDGVARIVASPGISDADPLLAAAGTAGIDIVSDIQLFVDEARAPFVAVTGSNGKSTVTTLLALMCRAAGRTAQAGANLGVPALDLLQADVPDLYLLELSSFQLMRTHRLPARVAVLLNVSSDHLDWHRNEAEYRAAKYRVFREAAQAVYNRADAAAAAHLGRRQTAISFGLDRPAAGQYGLLAAAGRTFLARGRRRLLDAAQVAVVGTHNRANALAALAAGELLGLDTAPMLRVLRDFRGLPHRMQFVRRRRGVAYVNDSKATNVAAARAAVTSVAGPVVLIAGGQGKGGDFAAFAAAVQERLRAAVLIGEDAGRMERALGGWSEVRRASSMAQAVATAAGLARAGDTVLLAPACASFDQFADYRARGDAFCRAVRELPA